VDTEQSSLSPLRDSYRKYFASELRGIHGEALSRLLESTIRCLGQVLPVQAETCREVGPFDRDFWSGHLHTPEEHDGSCGHSRCR
jgi:hypothetical protein